MNFSRAYISIFLPLILLFLAGCQPVIQLSSDPEVLKWETEIAGLVKLPVSTDPNTILFTGSSSIRLWNTIEEDMLPYKAVARGYGGAKLNDYVYYCSGITGPQSFGAAVVFIANDITGDSTDKSPEAVLHLMKQTVRLIRKSHPGVPVFWIEITPTPSRWKSWDKISAANNLIMEYSKKRRHLFFISTSDRFLGADGKPLPELFQPDMLHLNEAGYRIWADCIRQELDAEVPELKTN
ncbi:MAG: GDSL-type esterase/lipase family protein [Bacteroidota bacterium]